MRKTERESRLLLCLFCLLRKLPKEQRIRDIDALLNADNREQYLLALQEAIVEKRELLEYLDSAPMMDFS